jgi:drug/metabolite transporter (DMT)-like permease
VRANFWRVIVATLLLGAWAHSMGQGMKGAAFGMYFLSGLVGFGLGDVALYQAFPRIGSRLSILLVHCLAAPIAAATEWIWMGSAMSAREIAAAALILAGVGLALAPGGHLGISRRAFWTGVVLGVCAAVGQGEGAVLSRRAVEISRSAGESIDGLTAAYQRILAGVVVAAAFLWIARSWSRGMDKPRRSVSGSAAPPLHSAKVWPWVVVNALAGPALGVGCYQWALMREKAGVVLPIVALTPLVIIPFSGWVEGDRPTIRSLAGGIIAVAGAVLLAGAVAAK